MSIGIKVKVVHILSEEDIDQQEMGVDLDFSDNVPEEYTLYTISFIIFRSIEDKSKVLNAVPFSNRVNDELIKFDKKFNSI